MVDPVRRASVATVLAVGLVGTSVLSAAPVEGQPMPLMMMVGCVEGDEADGFHLARTTEPEVMQDRIPPEPAPDAPLGERQVRLIGTLYEFGVAEHVGHKVWARGILIEGESEARLNLVSITHLATACE